MNELCFKRIKMKKKLMNESNINTKYNLWMKYPKNMSEKYSMNKRKQE